MSPLFWWKSSSVNSFFLAYYFTNSISMAIYTHLQNEYVANKRQTAAAATTLNIVHSQMRYYTN